MFELKQHYFHTQECWRGDLALVTS